MSRNVLKKPSPQTRSCPVLLKSDNSPMSISSFFNGFYLECVISSSLLESIKKTIKKQELKLFTPQHIQCKVYPGMRVIIPIGIFSNIGYVLKCSNSRFTRNMNQTPSSSFENNITLSTVQEKIIEQVFDTCREIQQVNKAPVYLNIVGECSIGKTVMAIKIISEFGLKSFVVTPSIDLAKQWGYRIKEFMPKANYYVSTQGASNLLSNQVNPDILLVPSKHLLNERFNEYVANNFSICFVDEQHTYDIDTNAGLKHFFSFFSFPFVFSLTATPRDTNRLFLGREITFNKTISEYKPCIFDKNGYVIYIEKQRQISYPPEYRQYINCRNGKDYIIRSLYKKRCLSLDDNRNEGIKRSITQSYESPNAKILVLTHFVEEINYFSDLLSSLPNVFPIFAKTKNLDTVKNSIKDLDKYILIGTGDHLGTGIDVVDLNILHLTSVTTNTSKIIQYAGRVSRDNQSPIHEIYIYNISSYPCINLSNDCKTMINTLTQKGWNFQKKMIFTEI